MKSQSIQTSNGKIVLLQLENSGLSKKEMQPFVQQWIENREFISNKKLLHDSSGKPFLNGENAPLISISYARDTIAIYLSESKTVGIDIEFISTKIQKIVPLFISDKETMRFPSINNEILHLMWGAKEAVFKFHGGNFMDLKTEVEIEDIHFESKQIATLSRFGNQICNFEILENQLVLVYC